MTKQCCASLFNGGSEVFRKLKTPGSLKLNIKVRGRDQKLQAEAKAKAKGYEAEAKILASRPVWPRGFNISDRGCVHAKGGHFEYSL